MTTKIRIEKVAGPNSVAVDVLDADGKVADTKLLMADGESFNKEVHADQSFRVREEREAPQAEAAADQGQAEGGTKETA